MTIRSLLYELCNKEVWFTAGSIGQYEKMFDYAKANPHDIEGIALIIWLCSGGATREEIAEKISERLKELRD